MPVILPRVGVVRDRDPNERLGKLGSEVPVLLPCRDVFGTTLHRTSIFLRIEHFQEARVWAGKHDRVCNPCHHAKGQKQEPAAPATPCATLKILALVVLLRDLILV